MNYEPRNRQASHFTSSRTRAGFGVPTKILIALIVILTILFAFLPRVLPSLFLSLVAPVWKAEHDAKLGTATMEELRKAYAEMENNSAQNSALQAENAELKELFNRTTAVKPLLAAILKKPPFSAYDSFILDVGNDHKVAAGNEVYAFGNIPIGKIAEVLGNVSRVKLYSTAGEKFEILFGSQNIEATAEGKGGGYFEVSLPRDTKIKAGDQVLIPGLGNAFLATVDGIASDPSEPFAKILFHQPVNIYELRYVVIDTHASQ